MLSRFLLSRLLGIGIVGLSLWGQCIKTVVAQTVPVADNTLGSENSSVTSSDGSTFFIEEGAERGSNLFHSFRELSVPEGGAAYFVVDNPAIESIFSRVTENNVSNILGVLGTRTDQGSNVPSPADLYIINPNGVVFGPNASLDLGGSLVVTTADTVEFGDVGTFSVNSAEPPSPLLSVDPSAFLFSQNSIQSIVNASVTPAGTDASGQVLLAGLRVPNAESLVFLGGDISLMGYLISLGGRAEIASVGERGRVALDRDQNGLIRLAISDSLTRANVALNNALVFVADNGQGDIAVTANNIQIENSRLQAGIGREQGNSETQAGNIVVDATGLVTLSTGYISNAGFFNQAGNTGEIFLSAENLELLSGSALSTRNLGQGNSGNINVQVSEHFRADGSNSDGTLQSAVVSGTLPIRLDFKGEWMGGDINIQANSIVLDNGAFLQSSSSNSEDSGNIHLIGSSSIVLTNAASVLSRTSDQTQGGDILIQTPELLLSENSLVNSNTHAAGNAGDIKITGTAETNGAVAINGGGITANTFGAGRAGTIRIDIGGETVVEGENSFIEAATVAAGRGGDLFIDAASLRVEEGAHISATSYGTGDAGRLTIYTTERVDVLGPSATGTLSMLNTDIDTNISTSNDVMGGQLSITTGVLVVRDGAQVSSSVTSGSGTAGELIIVADTIELSGESEGVNGLPRSPGGLFAIINSEASGQGGILRVQAERLNISNGSKVQTITFGNGDAGDLFIDVGEINIYETEEPFFTTGVFTGLGIDPERSLEPPSGEGGDLVINSNRVSLRGHDSEISSAVEEGGLGSAGNVTINTDILRLSEHGRVSAESSGSGSAGNIEINVSDHLELFDGDILTESVNSSGGDILVNVATGNNTGVLVLYGDSDITTNSLKDGGNITLRLPTVAFDDSDILARSQGANGGNITLGPFFSATLSSDGLEPFEDNEKVDINADGQISSGRIIIPDTSFIQGSLTELSSQLINPESLVVNSCIARSNQLDGTFNISGTENLPEQPDELEVPTYSTGNVSAVLTEPLDLLSWQPSESLAEPQGIYQLSDGRFVMSRECR
jgi:filamentous hemagglutinin family protein